MCALENACSSMSTASSLAANCVCGCSSGLLQPVGSWVRKGCNSPQCALFVMSAGTQWHQATGWIYVGTGKCMQQHVNSQQPGCKLRLQAAVAGLLRPLAVAVRKGCATAPKCAPLVMSAEHPKDQTSWLAYVGTGKCMQQHVNSQQPGCKLRLRDCSSVLLQPLAVACARAATAPVCPFVMSAGTHSIQHQAKYIGYWKMHAAACQQPAGWLQTASAAAVAGCCSPWQLRCAKAATAPKCASLVMTAGTQCIN